MRRVLRLGSRLRIAGVAAVLALTSCDDPVAGTLTGDGAIELRIEASSPGTAAPLDAGRVLVRGPTTIDQNVTPGQTVTIGGLAPGVYAVALQGLVGGNVDHFGQVTGVTVVANQTTSASVSAFDPFLTDFDIPLPQATVNGKEFSATWTAVSDAAGYRLEVDLDPAFPIPTALSVMGTSTTVTLVSYARIYARVRAVDPYGGLGVPSGVVEVRLPAPMFLIRDSDGTLRRLDPLTGGITDVGPTGVTTAFGDCAWNPNNNTLYMVDGRSLNNLYRVNPTNGTATLVGTHGIADMFALGYHPPTDAVYGVSVNTNMLYRFNLVYGGVTPIGPTGGPYISGLVWDPVRNQFVGLEAGGGALYTVDVATGAATLLESPGTINDAGLTYDPTSDLFWAADYSGNIFQYDPTAAGYARTTVATAQGDHASLCYAPLP